jgi:N-acetylmuramoyl-L-alanine amidase
MNFNDFIEKISKKLSRKNLIIVIVLLSIAIIVFISAYIKNNIEAGKGTSMATATNTAAPNPPTVVIDPGHGGWEPGAGNGKFNEKDIVLDISLEIEKLLKEKNIDYYMIRTDDTYVSLEDRAKIANDKKSKLFISIHNNSFTDRAQSGILTTYNPYSPIGEEIAKIMQSRIKDLGMRDRDIMPRPNLYVLRHTEMPSLLLEIGFISNKKDLKLLTDTKFQQKCAQQIVLGIEDILSKYIPD